MVFLKVQMLIRHLDEKASESNKKLKTKTPPQALYVFIFHLFRLGQILLQKAALHFAPFQVIQEYKFKFQDDFFTREFLSRVI